MSVSHHSLCIMCKCHCYRCNTNWWAAVWSTMIYPVKWISHGEQELTVFNLTLFGYILGSIFRKHSQQRGRCMCLLMMTDDAYNKFVILCHCQQQDLNTCAGQLHTRDWLTHMMCKQSLFRLLVINLFSLQNFIISKREHYRQVKLYTQFYFFFLGL